MKNTVKDKKRPSQPRLDAERISYKKWLIFSKLHVLTENGVRPRKTVISTHHNKKQFRTKTVFVNQDLNQNACFNKHWLIFSKTQVLTQNVVRRKKTLLSTQNNEKHSLAEKTSF